MIKRPIAIYIALIFAVKAASAQPIEQRLHQVTEAWTKETGIYVPRAVRKEYIEGISNQIARDVSEREASATVVKKWDPSVRAEAWRTKKDQVADTATLTANALDRLATLRAVGFWLERYPTIRVIVRPTPPKDFLLTINGELCPATEKAMYRVPIGAVTIRVWRQGSAPCEKTYAASEGQVYDVHCVF
jgi:hypothetical protein